MDFTAFINASKTKTEEKQIIIPRIPEPFTIRTISEQENSKLRDSYTKVTTERGIKVPDFDSKGYQRALTALAVVVPDLRNAELQEALGTAPSAEDTLSAILKAGEYQQLQGAVLDFSGFNEELKDVKNEIKNVSTQEN